MKKLIVSFLTLATALLFLSSSIALAQVSVDQWGKAPNAKAWPILNDSTTAAGEAGIGNGAKPTGWASIRGGFADVEATTENAIVVSGQMELIGGGGGSGYTHLRYALTYLDSTTLNYQYTDSALWVRNGAVNHYGYEWCPRSGTGTIANGAWGVGTFGVVKNGNWNSTNSNGGPALANIKQAPTNAEMVAGVYNWAMSVQPLGDGSNEVRWYMVEENNKYWFGGTVIDTSEVATKFNGVCFGFNSDQNATQVNFMAVQVELGAPIDVPPPPWEPFYVNQWGKAPNAKAWPILNDSTYLDGDAGLGNGAKPTGWASIRGGFAKTVTATTEKAIIVTGQMELVGGGGGSGYTHLRYALTYLDSTTLNYQYTDSALWVRNGAVNHYGYEWCPRSGTGTIANGAWGVGTFGVVKNGNWNSTNSNGGPALANIKQAPTNAEMVAGVYNWAISVQPLGDGTNEVRWYMIEQATKYWFGGTVIDTSEVTAKFNGICFGFNSDQNATQVNLLAVKVDMGAPIDVPPPPWEPFYVNQWGKTPNGKAWPVLNDSTYLDGDAGLGNGAKPTGWATIRGGFAKTVTATTAKAIIVTGQMELVGGGSGSGYTHLRYALTYLDSTTLNYQYTDSALWVRNGAVNHYGYEWCPRSGTGTIANGAWGVGTVGVVKNGNWNSTNSNGGKALANIKQAPRNAEMVAGVYNWAISVRPLGDGTNEVRWYMIEQATKYWFGGTVIDTSEVTAKFNGICFGFNSDQNATQVNLLAVKVDIGTPIDVPPPPWQPYYVTDWGFSGGNLGGWKLTAGEFDGDVTIGGTAAPTGWSAVRGGFDPFELTVEDTALIITGKIELVGGGFEDLASLRYGIFYSDSSGTLQHVGSDSVQWSGTDRAHSGYLVVPPSGTNIASWSGTPGTWGGIANDTWWNIAGSGSTALGAQLQIPADVVAGPGTYDFAISVAPQGSGNKVVTTLSKEGAAYYFETSTTDPIVATTNTFNSVAFAINNSTTTIMNLYEVQVDKGPVIPTDINTEGISSQLPTVFSLSQNYPNPFNPTTNIKFGLPQNSDVNLVIYDVIGRVVAKITEKQLSAGYHEFTFNASKFSSGIYFYRIEAGKFVDVKKMMLLK